MTLEIVIEHFYEAEIAQKFGVKRVELVSAFDLSGLTPSYAAIKKCCSLPSIETHIMIRPRAGDFCYSADELEIMHSDIEMAGQLGAKGIVFGVLDSFGNMDLSATQQLFETAKKYNLEVTMHRAFDFSAKPFETLQSLIKIGFDRILSSGLAGNAELGLNNYPTLKAAAENKIQIMAGGGINANTAEKLKGKVDAIHFAIRKAKSQQYNAIFGKEYEIDFEKIEAIKNIYK